MALQESRLTMTGLGLAVADQIEAGIHLRWSMVAARGFPRYGFDLERRESSPVGTLCLKMSAPDGTALHRFSRDLLTVASVAAMVFRHQYGPSGEEAVVIDSPSLLTVSSTTPLHSFSLTTLPATGTVRLAAFDQATIVAEATIPTTGGTGTVTANRISHIIVTTTSPVAITQLCRLTIDEANTASWVTHVTSLNLPATTTAALARLPVDRQSLYRPQVAELLEVTRLLRQSAVVYTATGPAAPPPTFTVRPLQLLLLAAIDPSVARMVGLAYVDLTAAIGTVYDYRITGHWTGPQAADERWICFGLSRGTPPAVPIPTGLTATPYPVSGGLMEGTDSTRQALNGLTWDVPSTLRSGLEPLAPIGYHLHRQSRGRRGWTAATPLTTDRPIIVTTDDQGQRPTSYYVDGPLAAGTYRYQVQAVDLFGRTSDLSPAVAVASGDAVPPPPPLQVSAQARRVSRRVEAAVRWTWSAEQRAIAGDAVSFQVYYQTDQLRGLSGIAREIRDNGDGTYTLRGSLTSRGDVQRSVGGVLINRGRRFPVISASQVGREVTIQVRTLVGDDGTALRPSTATPVTTREALIFVDEPGQFQGRFIIQPDWSQREHWVAAGPVVPLTEASDYRLVVTNLPLTTGPLTPVAYAFIGVATLDSAGNQGLISAPVTVAVAHETAPPTPPAPGASAVAGPVYATRADYHGRSRHTVTIEASASGLHYDLYRALDAAILARANVTTADDDTLLSLAAQYPDAFTRLDTRDAAGAALTGTGGPLSYTDTLPGTGRNRFVYAMQAVDLAGNRSPLSPGQVVHLIDVLPPRPPRVTRVSGGDRRIVLQWATNREADLALYRLYRATDSTQAADIRSMALVASFILDSVAATDADRAVDMTAALGEPSPGQVSFADTTVAGLVDYFYRLVAIDTAGNASIPSAVIHARAVDQTPPTPPPLTDGSWRISDSRLAVRLSWSPPAAGVQVLVQRRELRATAWQGRSSWLPETQLTFFDTTAQPHESYVYRLQARSAVGNLNTTSSERSVTALYAEV